MFAAWVCIESPAGLSNYLPVKKNRRFLSFVRQAVPLFWRLDAEEGVTAAGNEPPFFWKRRDEEESGGAFEPFGLPDPPGLAVLPRREIHRVGDGILSCLADVLCFPSSSGDTQAQVVVTVPGPAAKLLTASWSVLLIAAKASNYSPLRFRRLVNLLRPDLTDVCWEISRQLASSRTLRSGRTSR